MISIKTKRNRGLIRRLEMASKVVTNIVQEEIESTAVDIYDLATADTPVDLGILKAGNNYEVGELRSENYNTVRYAPYIEFGTGGLVNVPAGLEDYASQFKGEGVRQVNLLPRPFLFPNARQQSKILVDRVRRRTLKYLK
jgi:hypothetical protein